MSTRKIRVGQFVFSVVTAMSAAFSVQAASSDANMPTAEQRYKQERAACLDGSSHQDRATCLTEATNAFAEARKNPVTSDRAERRENALARCSNVRANDKAACERLALGKGKESGSVEGGGVIKETVTRTVGPPIVIIPAQPK